MTNIINPHMTTSRMSAAICALLLGAAPLIYAHFLARQTIAELNSAIPNPMQSGRAAQKIIQAAASFSYIPKDEVPTVQLVTDPAPFAPFILAEPGDRVLVYRQANLAVLFDPQTANVINVIAATDAFSKSP